MSRGFITIATGDKKYHEMAKTLVRSYKLTSASPVRFGVITDEADDKFEEFDDVVLIKDATCSYMDKIDICDIAHMMKRFLLIRTVLHSTI